MNLENTPGTKGQIEHDSTCTSYLEETNSYRYSKKYNSGSQGREGEGRERSQCLVGSGFHVGKMKTF